MTMDYTGICFVIMPFGSKQVGDREVNFDQIYETVFSPAITETVLPEGGMLVPRRTDRDFFSGDISAEMFGYLEYARFALADISGLNPNVFYELGVRHGSREAGTAVFRQTGAPIPFDIRSIKAFDYEYEPEPNAAAARELITRVLSESLRLNRLDSPVQIALRAQQRQNVDGLLIEAENAIRCMDWAAAIDRYRQTVYIDQANPLLRQRLGLLLKNQGNWKEALEHFTTAVQRSPSYAEAYREKGIAENKLAGRENPNAGEHSLRRAIELNPDDFDALASLGGILKRQRRYEDALAFYRRATRVSRGHPYPLLNELKLEARTSGELLIDDARRRALQRAEQWRRRHVNDNPPYDVPWSFFDLSEIRLYLGDPDEFRELLEVGIEHCHTAWQVATHRESLELIVAGDVDLPGLADGIAALKEAEEYLS